MGFRISGVSLADIADVILNKLQVNLPVDPAIAGYARLIDSNGNPILTTENGALSVSQADIVFRDQVEGNVLNTNLWQTSVSGITVSQVNGFITLNAGLVTTANLYAIVQSIKYFPMYGYLPLKVTFNAATPSLPQNNATIELGIGAVAGNSLPTDGCFFRWNSSAEFKCVVNNGGVETLSAAMAAPPVNDSTLFEIVIVEDLVRFMIDDAVVAEIEVPAGYPFPTNAGRIPIFGRVYNGSSAPALAPVLWIGQAIVAQEGASQNRDWSEFLASMGMGGYQLPISPFTQTHQWANSAAPSAATLSNTAAGYATKGGRFIFNAPGAAETDFALFAWQNTTGYQEFIAGIKIDTASIGAAAGVSASLLEWGLGVNSSGVSLATAEAPPTTWSPKRIPLGQQSIPGMAAIGYQPPSIFVPFTPPVPVDSGRYGHIICRVPVGLATTSQQFRGLVSVLDFLE